MGVQVQSPGPFVPVAGSATAQGSVTSPGAGANVSGTIAAASLPAGLYQVTIQAYIDGTPAPATDDDNMKINQSGGNQTHLTVPSNGQPVSVTLILAFNGAQTIAVQATAAGTAGAVYHASIQAVRIA